MKVVDPGHRYEVDNLQGHPVQTIGFVKKQLNEETGVFETVADGTTNEEVLAVLIDRIQTLNKKAPCRENSICLTHLETALLWLNARTQNRINRGVEGTPAA